MEAVEVALAKAIVEEVEVVAQLTGVQKNLAPVQALVSIINQLALQVVTKALVVEINLLTIPIKISQIRLQEIKAMLPIIETVTITQEIQIIEVEII